MKKIVSIIIIIVAFAAGVNAQITNVKIGDQVTIDKLYAGVLIGGQFRTDTVSNDAFVNARIGAMGTWRPAKWFAFRTWGIYDFNLTKPFTMERCWLNFTPHKKVSINLGYMATLATEQRPHPATGDGQFETFSESQLPGGTYNVKIAVDATDNFSFGACVAYRKGLEYQAMLRYNKVKISGWYGSDQKFGSALTLDFSRVYNVTSWRQDQVIANFLCVKMGKKKDYCLYSDNGYNLKDHKLVRSESGFLKTFDSQWIKGLFGLGYRYETKSINGYLFVHL